MNNKDSPKGERIAKVMARSGVCSRRDAEKLILEGRVKVNKTRLTTPAFLVTPNDRIFVDGKLIGEPEKTRLFLYHKPAGLVTTAKDERGRKTVFDDLPRDLPRLLSIGRLDLNTEGLLLLTNNGELSRTLELPDNGWIRRYRVRAYGILDSKKQKALAGLEKGITIEGIKYGSILITPENEQDDEMNKKTNHWLAISLTEGKNREIRRVLEHFDLQVSRLIRVSYGPFQLGNLPRGKVKEVPQKVLKDQLPQFVSS